MHITAHLDVDVVALETEHEVSVLVELTAPPATAPTDDIARPPRTLQVVLDRSGSMGGDRLGGAIHALLGLVDRLDAADNFGLVAFDDRVELTVPAGALTDKRAAKRAIGAVAPRGGTDLSAGYLRGVQEARRVAGPGGATVLLISDGHANVGVTDPEALSAVAADAHRHGVSTSTLGFGLGYDERIMSALARGGAGTELFAEEPDSAVALIAGEVEGLLTLTAQAASVLIRLSEHVRAVHVVNDLSVTTTGDGVLAELGSFYSDEQRKLVLVFDVPALASLGLTEVATLEFTYVELPTLTNHTVTMPLHVNVVPGDEAAGRIPDAVVRTELLYQRVQQAKRRASSHLSSGDTDSAMADIRDAQATVTAALSAAPPEPVAAELAEEAQTLGYLAQQTEYGMISRAAKYSSMDASHKSSKRGRQHHPSPRPQAQEPQPESGDERQ
jgi:Ca-activated chloride channel family protein